MRDDGPVSPISVLIADDSALFREELRMALARETAIVVVGAVDGHQAAGVTEALRPDILLLAVSRLGQAALDTLPVIRKQSPNTHVLILSEESDDEFIGNALQLGAKGCVSKTVDYKDLVKALWTIYAGEMWAGRKLLAGILESLRQKTQEINQPFSETQSTLTIREQEIVRWVIRGMTNKQIAAQLEISDKTVKAHLSNIFSKLKINRRLQLALYRIVELTD
ncbi:LuxR family two component transcriptional regulator [Candidatus Methylomirabilis lanthanidiphila]|uniref:LuxR family two component transcriptional regulator n=1 Tax=Candidatus Methylomirabilis lanthanidiphila TaxID=2211376 RepID=A0A564ZGT5_9BACT|nr:LuxR family two component transcriptional regulator [Candidatus Methylomirabilis lanthanidiphila]